MDGRIKGGITMDVREKLVELIESARYWGSNTSEEIADRLIANGVTVQECAKPLEEWGEDYGDVLWWKFPIEEPPYIGSPLDANWPAYHTHWTTIPMPQPPKGD
jgi:hypothetical protein